MNFTLRKFRDSDLASLVKYANNHNVAKFLTNGFPHPYSEEDGRKFLSMASNNPGIFAIDVEARPLAPLVFFHNRIFTRRMPKWVTGWQNLFGETESYRVLLKKLSNTDFRRLILSGYSPGRSLTIRLHNGYWKKQARLKNAIYKNGNYMDELIFVVRKDE